MIETTTKNHILLSKTFSQRLHDILHLTAYFAALIISHISFDER